MHRVAVNVRSAVAAMGIVLMVGAALSLSAACAGKKGGLMLAMGTDMKAPKDVSAVGITVQTNGVIRTSFIARVTPDGDVKLPATLAVIQPDDPNATVRLRVLALKESKVRVLRDVRTTIPKDGRIGLLRLSLDFIDDGSAKPGADAVSAGVIPAKGAVAKKGGAIGLRAGGAVGNDPAEDIAFLESICPGDDQTSIDGECADDFIDSSTLPDYSDDLVHAGGPPGACFPTASCFPGAQPLAVDDGPCTTKVSGDVAKLNLALVTPSTGECLAAGQCFIPLDKGAGWDAKAGGGGLVTLKRGVCKKIKDGSARLVEAYSDAPSCAAKTQANPVCQQSTGDPPPALADGGVVDGAADSGPLPFDGGADAGPFFNNPKLGITLATGFGAVNASLHAGTSWYIGGQFDRVSAYTVANFTGINTGSAVPIACPLGGFSGPVKAVAQTATAIYVGGGFAQYRGAPVNNIAKLDPVTCALDTTFSPPANGGFDNQVNALAANATDVYVGGAFTAYRGVASSALRIAKLNATTGAIDTAFSPVGINQNGFDNNQVNALVLTATSVYVGGSFTNYKGSTQFTPQRIAKLGLTTGAIDTTFTPMGLNGFNGEVDALAANATDLYAGGNFTAYKGITNGANRLAKLNLATGAIDATFSPPGPIANGFDNTVLALALSGTDLYAGGQFTAYKGVASSANGLAKLNATTGAIDAAFSPVGAGANGFDTTVRALLLSGTDLYVGGSFGVYRGATGSANKIAKLNATTGAIDAKFLPADGNISGVAGVEGTTVNALALSGTTLWIGGEFSTYGGTSVNNIAKVDDVTFAVDKTFSPAAANGFDGSVMALAASGTDLYVGGNFTSYRGINSSANHLAKLDRTTGAIDTTFSPPGATANGFESAVRALAADAASVYAGGAFLTYKGGSANRIAKLDRKTGVLDATFSPATNGFNNPVDALALDGTDLFVGGEFTTYKGVANSANRIAKLDTATGAEDTTFSPLASNGFAGITGGATVFALALTTTDVYVGGGFISYRGATTVNNIAKLARATGAVDTTFSPPGTNGFDNTVLALAAGATDVYVGGVFTAYRSVPGSANRIAKLGPTGTLDTTFSPPGATANGFDTTVSALGLGTSVCSAGCGPALLTGGGFTTYRGTPALGLALLDPSTGVVK